jgi:hypothetical protein
MFFLAGDAVLQVFFKCRLHRGIWMSKYSASFKKTQSGDVMPFKCWLLEVVGDHRMRAVWGMAPNNWVKFNQN